MPLDPWLATSIFGFVAALLVSLAATPAIRRLATTHGIVDHPAARRANAKPVARGGGVAIAMAFVVVAAIILTFTNVGRASSLDFNVKIGLLGGTLLAALIGAIDDVRDLRPRWQFLGQAGVAILAVACGILVQKLNSPFPNDGLLPLGPLAGAFTAVWIIGTINSLNFIDGLDGLSTGIAAIAALTLGLVNSDPGSGNSTVSVLSFILAGALLGFLKWNFFPASVFPGTAGVMAVGFALAVLSVLGPAKTAVALLVLGIPIIDTFWIIVRRIASRSSPFVADRGHVHHRLLDLGLSHRAAVLTIYAFSVALAALAIVLSDSSSLRAFIGLLIASGIVLVLIDRRAKAGTGSLPNHEDDL